MTTFHFFKDPHGNDIRVNLDKVVSYQSYSAESIFTELNFGTHLLVIDYPIEELDKLYV